MTKLANLKRALDRLDKSDTRRKRQNAIIAFKRAVRTLSKETLATYRSMRKDGTLVPVRKKKGGFCPYCKVPMGTLRLLAKHLLEAHRWYATNACPCGKRFLAEDNEHLIMAVAMHISRFPDLGMHLAKAELLAVAKERRAAEA